MVWELRRKYFYRFLYFIDILVPQHVFADSPYDLLTNNGGTIPFSNTSVPVTPSPQGYLEETPVTIPNETVAPIPQPQPESIIGNDERTRVTNTKTQPYPKIVYLSGKRKNGVGIAGTGTMIAPDTVLTAAHMLFPEEDKGWIRSMNVYPAANGDSYRLSWSKKPKINVENEWKIEIS